MEKLFVFIDTATNEFLFINVIYFYRLQNKDVFELIRRYDLYNVIHKMIIPLMQLDRERAFQILLNKNKIPPEIVVQQLEQNQDYLYMVKILISISVFL